MKSAAALFLASALLLAAGSALAQDASSAVAEATTSVTPEVSGHLPPPPAGKAQVVFFRTGAYMGAATWFKVRENGGELGKLSNQSYFVAVLDPGPHTFTAATENKNVLKLELEAGETSYVRGTLQMGIILYEPNMAPVDEALFEKHRGHMHLVAVTTSAVAPAKSTDQPAG